jgi:hypothetical protein
MEKERKWQAVRQRSTVLLLLMHGYGVEERLVAFTWDFADWLFLFHRSSCFVFSFLDRGLNLMLASTS